jgi:hypothetical protein
MDALIEATFLLQGFLLLDNPLNHRLRRADYGKLRCLFSHRQQQTSMARIFNQLWVKSGASPVLLLKITKNRLQNS